MTGNLRAAVCALLGGLLSWPICGTGLAQDVPARPEVLPAPAPTAVPQQDRPQVTYGPLQAGQDAYRMAEQERAWAVQRQLQLAQTAWWYPAWPPAYVAGGAPIRGSGVYVYAPPRVGHPLVGRRAYRYGYWPAPQPWPYVPAGVYAYPYSAWVGQPTGYQQIWIGPNGYVYRPYYWPPAPPQNVLAPVAPSATTPALPSTRPPQPTPGVFPPESPMGPSLNGPIRPIPESIPPPPAEPPPE